MLFNSLAFLVFFPLVTLVYFYIPQQYQNKWLLLSSCFFYMYLVPYYILIVGTIIVIDYFAGRLIEHQKKAVRKLLFLLSIFANLGILFIFKYADFFSLNMNHLSTVLDLGIEIKLLNLVLPLGISFHTFQSMSYVIDVYRGEITAEKNFFTYALFVMFYPQLVAGPIEKASVLIPQFYQRHTFDWNRLTRGLWLMLWGLFQKVVVADRLGIVVNTVYNNPAQFRGMSICIAMLMFVFQIYCDFCGYSDIAVGAAHVMGFDIMTNFNAPLASRSMRELWSRWHVTLMRWFHDYIYIPIVKRLPNYKIIALFIVFLLSGFWHGARWTFVIFGLFHACYVIAENKLMPRRFRRKHPYFASIVTFLFFMYSGIFFRANTLTDVGYMISHLFKRGTPFASLLDLAGISVFAFTIDVILMSIIFSVQYYFYSTKQNYNNIIFLPEKLHQGVRWIVYYGLILGILFGGEFSSKQFIYFQF